MVQITNKQGAVVTAKSLNGLMTELGLGGTRNTKAHLTILKKEGFNLETLQGLGFDLETLTTTTTRTRNSFSIIERLEKLSSVIDKEKIENQEKVVSNLFENLSPENVEEFKTENQKLQELKNPIANLDMILEYVTEQYNKLIVSRETEDNNLIVSRETEEEA